MITGASWLAWRNEYLPKFRDWYAALLYDELYRQGFPPKVPIIDPETGKQTGEQERPDLWDEAKVKTGLQDKVKALIAVFFGTEEHPDWGILNRFAEFLASNAEVQSVVIGSGIPVAIDPLDPLVGATTADGEQSGTGRIQ